MYIWFFSLAKAMSKYSAVNDTGLSLVELGNKKIEENVLPSKASWLILMPCRFSINQG